MLLEDFVLREKIIHFDHERIPERIVHARGTARTATSTLTSSLADFTTAACSRRPACRRRCSCASRPSPAAPDRPTRARDVRGFAVKFYTKEGNWDLVGNNIPVFFIQDAIKFPDLIHAVKTEPDRDFPQAATAHDTFWDFISLTPESHAHADVGHVGPRDSALLRMMEGFGVHTFRLVNAAGESTFVKFHWQPSWACSRWCGTRRVKIAGADPDFHRRDLCEAIEAGAFPEWELGVQLFTEEEADGFAFDLLDATKLIPEELVPLRSVGRMVLDRKPDNFFAETEQVAFCAGNVVPGIDFSNDPLLQGRLFSYLDTQLMRLGAPNFHQLPINAPKSPSRNYQRDGFMQMTRPTGRVAYEPNSLAGDGVREAPARGVHSAAVAEAGDKARIRSQSFADHYSQARQFYRSQTPPEQRHIASALVFELSKVAHPHVREAVVGHLRIIDEDLASRVSAGLGLSSLPEAPRPASPVVDLPLSPALQLDRQGEAHAAGPPDRHPRGRRLRRRRGARRHGGGAGGGRDREDRRAQGRRRDAGRRQAARSRRPARRHALRAVRCRRRDLVRARRGAARRRQRRPAVRERRLRPPQGHRRGRRRSRPAGQDGGAARRGRGGRRGHRGVPHRRQDAPVGPRAPGAQPRLSVWGAAAGRVTPRRRARAPARPTTAGGAGRVHWA